MRLSWCMLTLMGAVCAVGAMAAGGAVAAGGAMAAGGASVADGASADAMSRPAVVELFTSEGCSSCPAAEALIGELTARGDVLALTYHVDYWDSLGWRDRFALPAAVARQRAYAEALGRREVYTPQAIVDGRTDVVGSDRRALDGALAMPHPGVAVRLSVRDAAVVIDLAERPRQAAGELTLVTYRRRAVSPIGRGENAGRTLQEYNIVRSVHDLGRWDGHERQYREPLAALPADATDVAVLVQTAGRGSMWGAATVALR